MSLADRDREIIWHPYTSLGKNPTSIAIVKARDSLLFDEDGKTYIDAISSWWVNLHGHANQKISQAIALQAEKLEQVIFAGFTHEPGILLAEMLLKILQESVSPSLKHIFYSDNGSTSVEVALKIALQFWRNIQEPAKQRILAFSGAYHGDTFGAMSASARGLFTDSFKEKLFSVTHIALPCYNNSNKQDLSAYLIALEAELAKGDIAAFIYEPLIQGAAGMQIYSSTALDQILKLCRAHKVILIADEVMTGFGRTKHLFASESLTTEPDIICLSKGITGGFLPLGATIVANSIYLGFCSDLPENTFFHGHSYTANPLACSAAVASLELLTSAECHLNRSRISSQHLNFIQLNQSNPKIFNLRSLGTVLAMELGTKNGSGYLNNLRDKLYNYYLSKGVLLRPLGNTVYVLPPYCITHKELEYVYQTILSSVLELI